MANPASVGASVGLTKANAAVRPTVASAPDRVSFPFDEQPALKPAAQPASVVAPRSSSVSVSLARPPECGRAVALFDFSKRNPDEIDLFAHETVSKCAAATSHACAAWLFCQLPVLFWLTGGFVS